MSQLNVEMISILRQEMTNCFTAVLVFVIELLGRKKDTLYVKYPMSYLTNYSFSLLRIYGSFVYLSNRKW